MSRDAVLAQLRQLLNDAGKTIWSDALLVQLIDQAREYFSRQYPFDDYADIATVEDSRDLSLSTLIHPVRVYGVEWPIDEAPKSYQHYGIFGDVLTMDSSFPGDGSSARVYYGRYRELWPMWVKATAYAKGAIVVPTVSNGLCYECTTAGTSHATTEPTWDTDIGDTTTDNTVTWTCHKYPRIDPMHFPVLCLGASGYAYEEYGRRIMNDINTGGPQTASRYAKQGYYALENFRKEVRQLSGAHRLKVRQLYTPRDPRASRFTDPGP